MNELTFFPTPVIMTTNHSVLSTKVCYLQWIVIAWKQHTVIKEQHLQCKQTTTQTFTKTRPNTSIRKIKTDAETSGCVQQCWWYDASVFSLQSLFRLYPASYMSESLTFTFTQAFVADLNVPTKSVIKYTQPVSLLCACYAVFWEAKNRLLIQNRQALAMHY